MTPTWRSETPREIRPINLAARIRAIFKGLLIVSVTLTCLALLLVLRVIEWPLFGARRPVTPYITQFVCRFSLRVIGLKLRQHGQPMRQTGALVANHSSWLDIFVLNALDRIYFVAKTEVARWPLIGWLARATGTLFVERRGGAAGAQRQAFHDRIEKGHRLLFFPEGTSTDGLRVLGFKSTLFAAFFDVADPGSLFIQPVSVTYHAPDGQEDRFYGFWGDTDFLPHFFQLLAAGRHGSVDVVFHDPLRVSDFPDRKSLAAASGQVVAQGFADCQEIAET